MALRIVTSVFMTVAIIGCGGSSNSPATKNSSLPNASDMFDKKEMPKGANDAKSKPG